MVTLLLVRHGDAVGNREGVFIGQGDVPLTDKGRHQAARLGDRLSTVPIDRVMSSDLVRCVDTVAGIAADRGLPLTTDRRLREIANGQWQGLVPEDIRDRWPELWHRYRVGEDVLRPGGESWSGVAARVRDFLGDLTASSMPGETVLVSTHAGPTLTALFWAAGIRRSGNVFTGPFGPIENCSISTVVLPGPRLAGVNDARHVAEESPRAQSPRIDATSSAHPSSPSAGATGA